VVATDVGELAAMVAGCELGTLYRPGDPRSLASAIEQAQADYPRLRAAAERARPALSWERDRDVLLGTYAETTDRDVDIALANQFAIFAESHQIDAHMVIEAANSQPYSHIHRPGVAVGGHCIPVYPRLYLANDPDATVVRAARLANAAMPTHAVDMLADALGDLRGQRVVILGAAYRGGVKETAFSGVFPLAAELRRRGALSLVHDPLYSDAELRLLGLTPYHLREPADTAVVQTDDEMHAAIGSDELPGVKALFDGRRVTDPRRWTGVRHATIGVGRGS
jgi:nucleotide sugar dehydrogenase